MSKRVVVMVTHWDEGGAQRAALRLAKGLKARGHDAELWVLYGRSQMDTDGMALTVVDDRHALGLFGYLRLLPRTLRALKATKPDAVISFLPLASLVGQLAALMVGVRNRVASHRVRTDTYHPLMRWGDWLFGNTGIYTSAIAVSEAVRRSLPAFPGRYRNRTRVVHNGLDWQPSSLDQKVARRVFDLPDDATLLLSVGRMAAQKNYPVLLDAVAQCPDLHLVVAGDGPLRPGLEGQADSLGLTDRLHLLGHVQAEQITDLYRACDAFTLASLFEGQSNALLEAMQEGMVIFASDIPEQVETLVDEAGEAAGVLLPASDAAAWASAFAAVLGDPEQSRALKERAETRAQAFTYQAMMDGFEASLDR